MKRSERIREKISIFSVLSSYKYDVVNREVEQQFRCNLHGDGSDNAPSARAYPESNTWYCFACGKVRDSISTVMEIEGLSYSQACKALELKYGLPAWVYKNKEDPFKESESNQDIEMIISRVESLLQTKTRDLPLDTSLKLWEVYNMLSSIEDKKKHQWLKLYVGVMDAK